MSDFFPMQVLNTVAQGQVELGPEPDAARLHDRRAIGLRHAQVGDAVRVAAAAQVDKTAESLSALLNELTGMVKGIPSDELARAKDDTARQFPKTFEATGRISSRLQALESLVVYGLPDDYYANYATAIQAVGAGDVQRVAQQYIHPDHLTIVIVGDRKTIEPSIRALNLGSIKELSIDEVFAPVR